MKLKNTLLTFLSLTFIPTYSAIGADFKVSAGNAGGSDAVFISYIGHKPLSGNICAADAKHKVTNFGNVYARDKKTLYTPHTLLVHVASYPVNIDIYSSCKPVYFTGNTSEYYLGTVNITSQRELTRSSLNVIKNGAMYHLK